MKLRSVNIGAYKSLLEEEIEFKYPCMGMVGINESGKTNVLRAVQSLSSTHSLGPTDTPKMAKESAPHVRFSFELSAEDRADIASLLASMGEAGTQAAGLIGKSDACAVYHVSFNREFDKEQRFFTIENLVLPPDCLVLRQDALTSGYYITLGEDQLPILAAPIVSDADIRANLKLQELSEELQRHRADLKRMTEATPPPPVASNDDVQSRQGETPPVEDSVDETSMAKDLRTELREALKESIVATEQRLGKYDFHRIIAEFRSEKEQAESNLAEAEATILNAQHGLQELESTQGELDAAQKKKSTNLKRLITTTTATVEASRQALSVAEKHLDAYSEPLQSKYTRDEGEVSARLGQVAGKVLLSRLPQVVFWTYRDDFRLSKSLSGLAERLISR